MSQTDVLDFSKLEYGAYEIVNDAIPYTEDMRYAVADFMKLHIRRVRLPFGKGNIIYLLADSFDHTLDMIDSKSFMVPPTYRRLFYPMISMGSFMKRRYRFNLIKLRTERLAVLKKRFPNIRPFPTRTLPANSQNIFFSAGDLYAYTKPIAERYAIKRLYTEYFGEFIRILKEMTPDVFKESDSLEDNQRLLIIDADKFAFKLAGSVEDNKTNPLFLLYLSYVRDKDLSKYEIDQDMMICSRNMFIKFNPAKMTRDKFGVFRRALFRIMKANLDEYTEQLPEEEKETLDTTSKDIALDQKIDNRTELLTKNVSLDAKNILKNSVKQALSSKLPNISSIKNSILPKENISSKENIPPIQQQTEPKSFAKNVLTEPEEQNIPDIDEYDDEEENIPEEEQEEEDLDKEVDTSIMNDDGVKEEVLDELQQEIIPLNNKRNSPINTARDQKLREEQRKIIVKESTIEDILTRDSNNIPIVSSDKSKTLKTSNKNAHTVKFANFEKTYIDKLYTKDLVSCFDVLKDKNNPFYITGIEVKDTSTPMDLKETWSVHLTDQNKKRSTIKVDIPKFYQNRFMIIGGNKYMILKQNFYNPLVKDTPDTVIMTTNYNKVTIARKATKSLSSVERLFSFIKKAKDDTSFPSGDSSAENMKYISCLEYDEIAKRVFKFKSPTCELCFSRDYILQEWKNQMPSDIKDNEFYIGTEGETPVIINEDTGLDRRGRKIIDIIEQNMTDSQKALFNSVKAPKQSMYVEAKMAGQFLPMIVILILWNGLETTLNQLGIRWNFNRNMKRIPDNRSSNYIKFLDGVLEYERSTFAELILNGLFKLSTEKNEFSSYNDPESVSDFIFTTFGTYNGVNELRVFHEFLIDPITKEVCRDFMLPDTAEGLSIHAVKLLSDNAYVNKASDKSYRVRSIETIPAILYSCIAAQYKAHTKSGGRLPMTLNQNVVIQKLMEEKTVDEYSTLNPAIEVGKTHTISTKGFKGSNSEYSYDEEKRSYDPSAVGKIAIYGSPEIRRGTKIS